MTIYPQRVVEKERVMSERMQIYGECVIRQGQKIIARGRNKFVGQALVSLCNMFSTIAIGHETGSYNPQAATLFNITELGAGMSDIGNKLTMRLGSDTVTPTTYDMVQLVSVKDTEPNSMIITRDNPSVGVYRAKYTATWNAGTVSGTVGEIGLFCHLQKTLGSNTLTEVLINSTLWSRLSAAGGDFAQFTIDNTKPLSVEWRIVFQF